MIAGSEKAPHDSEVPFLCESALVVHARLAIAVTNIWLAVLIFALVVCQLFLPTGRPHSLPCRCGSLQDCFCPAMLVCTLPLISRSMSEQSAMTNADNKRERWIFRSLRRLFIAIGFFDAGIK